MSQSLYFAIYIYPMTLLAILFVLIHGKAVQSMGNRKFQYVLGSMFLLTVFDLGCRMIDGAVFSMAYFGVAMINFLRFLLLPLVSMLWVDYIYYYVNRRSMLRERDRKLGWFFLPAGIFYAFLTICVLTGWFFKIDEANYYQRDFLFYLFSYLTPGIYILWGSVILFRAMRAEKAAFRKKQYRELLVLSMIPFVIGSIQAFFDTICLVMSFTVFVQLVVYLQMQRRQITQDALTKMNNRSCFDKYLKSRMQQADTIKSDCLFMMDLNHFKQINDVYGHTVGDRALMETASVLNTFFYGTDAFLARFGGDEFCAVCSCKGDGEAQRIRKNLKEAFEICNQTSNRPYLLEISIGYASLSGMSGLLPEEAIHFADADMYRDKREGEYA